MKDVLGMSHDEMADTFEEWNKGELDSFLVTILEITCVFVISDFEEY
jgi:6-phosphogluconate dehydrogenase